MHFQVEHWRGPKQSPLTNKNFLSSIKCMFNLLRILPLLYSKVQSWAWSKLNFQVLVGNNNYQMKAELKATKIYIHPGFTSDEEDYNIAAIEVSGTSRVRHFPKLPSKSLDFKSIMGKCKLTGYGKITSVQRTNFNIIQLNASNVEEFECRVKSEHRFCLHFYNLLPCNGDVGSPIICDDEFYAIFSPNMVIYPQM